MRVTVVHHLHRGNLIANATIAAAGARRIRQVFRYDLSPLFSRLHDPIERVPVVDATTRRALFVDAPRHYRLPLSVRVSMRDSKEAVRANLVVDKQGIIRLEHELPTSASLAWRRLSKTSNGTNHETVIKANDPKGRG